MKLQSWMIAVAGMAFVLPAKALEKAPEDAPNPGVKRIAPQAVTSSLRPIYRISGVIDSGAKIINTGIATSFHCTNWSAVAENIVVTLIGRVGDIIGTPGVFTVAPLATLTASTHATTIYSDGSTQLVPGAFLVQGSALISSTSNNISCSAVAIDAAGFPPAFAVELHMVRLNAASGTQE